MTPRKNKGDSDGASRTGRGHGASASPDEELVRLRGELESLKASERRFRTIAEFALEMIFVVDPDGAVLYANSYAARQIGRSTEYIVGRNLGELFPPSIARRQIENIRTVAGSGHSLYVETVTTFPAGNVWLDTWLVPLWNEEGRVHAVLGFSRDVTERVMAKKALRDKEELYRALVELSPDAITITDLQGRIIMANRHALAQAGFSSFEEMAGLDSIERIAPPYREGAIENMKKAVAGETVRNAEIELLRKDGSSITVEISTSVMADGSGQAVGFIGITRDVTNRKKIEEALRSSEEKFRSLVENLSEVLFVVSAGGVIEYISPSIMHIAGYSPAEVIGRSFTEFIHPDDLTGLLSSMAESLSGENRPYEYRIVRKDGSVRHVMSSSRPIVERGAVAGLNGILTDITGRKIAEERLAEEKERLSVTLRSIGDAVITTDTAGRVTLINGVAETLTGWRQEEASGRPIDEVFRISDGNTGKRMDDPVREIISTNRIAIIEKNTVLTARDGTERFIADSGSPIRDMRGKVIGAVIVFRDITEQLRMENELQKTQRLESLGVLAGGIAHDFNNILAIILGNISLSRLEPAPSRNALAGYLAEAEKGAVRAQELIRQLLTFSRGGAPIRKPVRIAALVRECVLFSLQGSTTKCEFTLPDGLWAAEIDEGQIRQVFSNLAINAAQAMPEGGLLEVSAENLVLDAGDRAGTGLIPLSPGNYVKVRVKDNGTGIPEANLARVFDPYFTTKPGGSGLGLAVVYSIVKNHGGYVGLSSHPGMGAAFTVVLPASVAQAGTSEEPPRAVRRGRGRVLVMDDEPEILVMARRMLSALGYVPGEARNGEEAIEKVKAGLEKNEPFDVVIMDLTIPGGMGGRTAVRVVKALDPRVKVIVSSGYSNDRVMSDFRSHGFDGVIAKPYRVEDLSAVLDELLAE